VFVAGGFVHPAVTGISCMFNFGRNWQDYSARVLDREHMDAATLALAELIAPESCTGKRFIDIGFGSGIASIAAATLGAESVIGIDISDESVDAAMTNAARFIDSAVTPEFRLGSILDISTVESLGLGDIVYAWGVLHHTGRMWDAVRNAARMVSPGGTLAIAIYDKHFTSPLWKVVKWVYNKSPWPLQRTMYFVFIPLIMAAKYVVTRDNPLKKRRGMDFFVDVVDWLGGYPYEYAGPQEIETFVTSLGFRLIKRVEANTPTGCNEFVFRKTDSANGAG